ncbi:sensor domain-containing diguanylate cyclase [Herbaspirillum sp. WGmk3]|uniref:sensor domain-containing diguanylate cyclase n=1 Tax=Herbaspirillum sp. WGmk3 TaxID=2919925 RepID=UPI002090F16D|nr:sensor domain-containing diguanylate cyclase [Herbaspirillum sp. WGmk3]MCO4858082.1 sensor domain-containing diguanylate cyclase [Herbaspirillum sp. WGmk3]
MQACPIKVASRAAKGFVAAVCIIILILEAWTSWHEHTAEMEESFRSTANMALALSQHADQALDEVDIVLKAVMEQVPGKPLAVAGNERLHNFLVRTVGEVPQLAGLFIYDEKGKWLASSQPVLETRFNNSDRDYFRHHQANRLDSPFIGKPIRSKSTGHWVLTMSRRVNKPDGSFGGVVLATLDIQFFERFYQKFDIGQQGVVLFGANDATILYRRPLRPDSMGKSLAQSPLIQQYVKLQDQGVVELRSTQDGVLRINGFKHLSNYPLFVIVGVSKEEILQSWTRHIMVRALGIALLLLAIWYGGNKMVAQVALRERAQAEAVRAQAELETMFELLQKQSRRDGLTGAINRRHFDELLEAEAARFARVGGAFSLLMIDVDHFKQYNDHYGHVVGDVCLRNIAAAISGAAQREIDTVARYGGEEFSVLLPECGSAGALVVAERIGAAVRAMGIPHARSDKGRVTVSIGITSITSAEGFSYQPRELIENADKALYQAKDTGRDRAVFREFIGRKPMLAWSA